MGEVNARTPATDCAVFCVENEHRCAGLVVRPHSKSAEAVKYEAGRRGCNFHSLWRWYRYYQGHNRARPRVKRGKAGVVVSDPHRASAAEIYAPSVDQVRVSDFCQTRDIRNKILLFVFLCS